jgi:hypothetical protein
MGLRAGARLLDKHLDDQREELLNMFMRQTAVSLLGLLLCSSSAMAGAEQVVIIKADDFRGPSPAWTEFLQASRKAGVKVSIGVIVEPTVGKAATADWMKAQVALGDVEFWNHGWDHKSWNDAGKKQVKLVDVISESDGTGKPNAEKFEALLAKRPKSDEPVSLQFHPPYFDAAHLAEYAKILEFLKAQHCSIRLPSECMVKSP